MTQIIAVLNHKGGTFYTVREAKRQGLDIVNLHNSV